MTNFRLIAVLALSSAVSMGFRAYDCSRPDSVVEAYSLLDPDNCTEAAEEYTSTRILKVEIVQTRDELVLDVHNCKAYRTTVSQYCGHSSAAGVLRWHKFREIQMIPASECRSAVSTGQMSLNGITLQVLNGSTTSHREPFAGDLADDHSCTAETARINGDSFSYQAGYDLYEVTVRKRPARLWEGIGKIRLPGGIMVNAGDRAAADELEGTFVWDMPSERCEETLSLVYEGDVTIHSNSSKTLTNSLLILEDDATKQYAGLEIQEATLVCGYTAYKTHVKSIMVLAVLGKESRIANSSFTASSASNSAVLQTEIAFLHVKAAMSLSEKLGQVRAELCLNRVKIAQTRLEAIAGTSNPYSLRKVFGPGHVATKSGAVVYVTKCPPVEVVPSPVLNCTEEIPVMVNESRRYVDPFSFILKPTGSVVVCNDIAPPRWMINEVWYCAYPEIRECRTPSLIPIEDVQVDLSTKPTKGLGKSLYSPEQMKAFVEFQATAGARVAYVSDAAARSFGSRAPSGEWGSGLSTYATGNLVDIVGWVHSPLFWVFGPYALYVTASMIILGVTNLILRIAVRVWLLRRVKAPGFWILGALFGVIYTIATAPLAWVEKATSDIANNAVETSARGGSGEGEDPEKGLLDHPVCSMCGTICHGACKILVSRGKH